MRSLTSLICVALILVLAGCGGDDKKDKSGAAVQTNTPKATTTATTPKTTSTAAKNSAGCEQVSAPDPKPDGSAKKPDVKLSKKTAYTATVVTTCGTFTIKLDSKGSPKTSSSFASLAQQGFYDDLTFHRIVPGFVIQGGDPTGTGQGGPGYSVVEPPPSGTKYTKGVVAMAKTEIEDPGTSGSQFYVVIGPDANLPPDYAVLGNVGKGQDVVDRIGAVPTGPDDKPLDPVVIKSVKITPNP